MGIGFFSVSLTVKDIGASKEFYRILGFKPFGGNEKEGWLIMKSDDCVIGLFQGMFPKNILTFNPGWDADAKEVNPFRDIREIQEDFKKKGIKFTEEADPQSTGPASFIIEDPDGNPILVDQHR